MSLEQMMGRYFRLTQELAIARNSPWQTGLITRLTHELTAVERDIAALQPDCPEPSSPAMRRAA